MSITVPHEDIEVSFSSAFTSQKVFYSIKLIKSDKVTLSKKCKSVFSTDAPEMIVDLKVCRRNIVNKVVVVVITKKLQLLIVPSNIIDPLFNKFCWKSHINTFFPL